MRIALIADLHGNLPAVAALERALARLRVDRVWCLGDLVGKGPDNRETLDWAFANCAVILGGNWDIGVSLRRFPHDAYYWKQLGEERMRRLAELPAEYRFTFGGRRVRLLHGRPVMPELLGVSSPADALAALFADGNERFQLVGYADTHRQALRTLSQGRLFNTGSVGNALGVPEVCFALLEADGEPTDGAFVWREARGRGKGVPADGTSANACSTDVPPDIPPDATPDYPPLSIAFHALPYDRLAAAANARADAQLPSGESFLREVWTGRYSRAMTVAKAGDKAGF